MRRCHTILATILVLAGTNSLQAQSYLPSFFPSRPSAAPVSSPGVSSVFSATMGNKVNALSMMQQPFKSTNGSLGRFLPSLPTMNPQNLMLGRTNGAPAPASQIITIYPAAPRFVPYSAPVATQRGIWTPW